MYSVEVYHLFKQYNQKWVLRNIEFCSKKFCVGILGPNGSGKTTLIRCLCGLTLPDRGQVKWFYEGRSYSQSLGRISVLISSFISWYANWNIIQNINFINQIGGGAKNIEKIIKPILILLGLWSYRHQKFGTLSSGLQKRAQLSLLWDMNRKIFFLDEPLTYLDDQTIVLIKQQIDVLLKSGSLVFWATNHQEYLPNQAQIIRLHLGVKVS